MQTAHAEVNVPDLINGSFETFAGGAVLGHVRSIYLNKGYSGVSVKAFVFFTLWGYFNLFYYPHLGQIISFVGGISVVSANTLLLYMLYKYRTRT